MVIMRSILHNHDWLGSQIYDGDDGDYNDNGDDQMRHAMPT